MIRKQLTITGQVQGVGFRPFVFRQAKAHKLSGTVLNDSQGVIVEVQGKAADIASFELDLERNLPPLAQIVSLKSKIIAIKSKEQNFTILKSSEGKGHSVLISPDCATCEDCLHDIFNADNPRYLYSFTNCTNCGPRYTITKDIPYDRNKTSMACFELCPRCRREYEDPMDRRFHAQPNACPDCGPKLWLTNNMGKELAHEMQAIQQTVKALNDDKIVAIKGLGGFHLACNACSSEAVNKLRQRKQRYGKPLAIMVANLKAAHSLAHISKQEKELLSSRQRPIVLLTAKTSKLAPELSPDTPQIGIMLPYTPLHHILFHLYSRLLPANQFPALVMTSGNKSSEPISLGNREALRRLKDIADLFLLHNRDILIRCDDSVLRHDGHKQTFIRRSRGYTPSPVFLAQKGETVLGVGPELKNTICLTKNDQAFVSQHIGNMENLETFAFFQETIRHLQAILQVSPQAIVCDLHPNYMSTNFALQQTNLPVFRLQHHQAHIYAVMAENKLDEPCIGLALDGTGYGEDGTIWGGELLFVDNRSLSCKRLGHFSQFALPGGEQAVREPWRIALSLVHSCGLQIQNPTWGQNFEAAQKIVLQMLSKNINTPLTSSCGRLFDGVSAVLGLRMTREYEGQAAIVLESIQDISENNFYDCPINKSDTGLILDCLSLFKQVAVDKEKGLAVANISRKFHLGLAHGLADWAQIGAKEYGVKKIALSGGVMLNRTLAAILPQLLQARGLQAVQHKFLSPGDGCISLGQAAYGQKKLQ